MSDKELTFLSFLADDLVARPKHHKDAFKVAFSLDDPSDEYLEILECLSHNIGKIRNPYPKKIVFLVQKLLKSSDPSEQKAGHVLRWGIRSEYFCQGCDDERFPVEDGLCEVCSAGLKKMRGK